MAKYKLNLPGVDTWAGDTGRALAKAAREANNELGRRIINGAPIKTGFLVHSTEVGLNKINIRKRKRPKGFKMPDAKPAKISEIRDVTKRMRVTDVFRMAFRADYAGLVHEGTGNNKSGPNPFVLRQVKQWPSIVGIMIKRYGGKKGV